MCTAFPGSTAQVEIPCVWSHGVQANRTFILRGYKDPIRDSAVPFSPGMWTDLIGKDGPELMVKK